MGLFPNKDGTVNDLKFTYGLKYFSEWMKGEGIRKMRIKCMFKTLHFKNKNQKSGGTLALFEKDSYLLVSVCVCVKMQN